MPVELKTGVLPPKDSEAEPPKRRGRPPGTKNKPKIPFTEQEIAEKLTETIAVPISFLSPIAGAVLEERNEKTAKALIRLATRYPVFAKYLATALEGTAAFDLILTFVAMGIGLGVDMQQLHYDSLPARAFGIDRIVMELYGTEENQSENGGNPVAKSRGLMGEV